MHEVSSLYFLLDVGLFVSLEGDCLNWLSSDRLSLSLACVMQYSFLNPAVRPLSTSHFNQDWGYNWILCELGQKDIMSVFSFSKLVFFF